MTAALAWGALAASSLVLGAWIGLIRTWGERLVGAVLGFGAGALISAVSFDLAQEGVRLGGGASVALGLACGAATYFVANRLLARHEMPTGHAGVPSNAGSALALGAFLDGVPERLALDCRQLLRSYVPWPPGSASPSQTPPQGTFKPPLTASPRGRCW